MVNWKNIHPEFTEELQKDWENKGFSYEEVQEWIKFKIKPAEYEFATYLKQKKYSPHPDLNWEELREEFAKLNEKVRAFTDSYVEGYYEMDHLYVSAAVDCEEVVGIKVIIESHDQGWGSGGSYTWGEIGILDSENKEKSSRVEIYRNKVADSQWQIHEKVVFDDDFLGQIKKGDKIAIWLKSMFPGWNNYARKGEIRFFEKGSVEDVKQSNENWINIHPDFTPELQQQWENLKITYQEKHKSWFKGDLNQIVII